MERRIDFEGSFNFRDLGGWRTDDGRVVRWRRVFRADSVHLLSAADARRAREEIRLRTLLDLRSDIEISVGGTGLLAEAGLIRHHLPITDALARGRGEVVTPPPAGIDTPVAPSSRAGWSADRSPQAMFERYWGMMHGTPDLIRAALEVIAAEESQPAVFFCSAGKDRTGVLSAAILGALRVREQDIVSDYELTADTIDRIIGRFASAPGAAAVYRDHPPEHFRPHGETMQMLLDRVGREYGSMEGYLRSAGVSDELLDRLRIQLLEPE